MPSTTTTKPKLCDMRDACFEPYAEVPSVKLMLTCGVTLNCCTRCAKYLVDACAAHVRRESAKVPA
jgi:hypothetical protein